MFILARYLHDPALSFVSSVLCAYAFGIDKGLNSQKKKDESTDH